MGKDPSLEPVEASQQNSTTTERNTQMTLEEFTELILATKRYEERFSALYKLGVDLLNLNDDYYAHVVNPLMLEAFGEDGADMMRLQTRMEILSVTTFPACTST